LLATDGVYFCDDWDGTNPTDTWTPTPGSLQGTYVYCPSGSGYILFNDPDLLLSVGRSVNIAAINSFWSYDTTDSTTYANTPSITINNWDYPNCVNFGISGYANILFLSLSLNQLSPDLLYFTCFSNANASFTGNINEIGDSCIRFDVGQSNTITGDIADIPASMQEFDLGGNNTVTGDIADLKEGLTYFYLSGQNTISGDIVNLPSTLEYISVTGNNTITGDMADFISTLTRITIGGYNTISGDIQDIESTVTSFGIYGDNTIGGDLDYWPSDSVIQTLNIQGDNTITGGFTALPFTLTSLTIQGNNTIDGLIEDIPSSVTSIIIMGNNIIGGTLNNLPSDCSFISLSIEGNNTITGDIVYLPDTLLTLNLQGANTVYGDLNDLDSTLRYIYLLGDNAISDYIPPSGGKTWYSLANPPASFNFQPSSAGGLSSTEVDDLIIDLDASTTTSRTTALSIYITGNNEPRTAASDAAVASLLVHNITVVTNP
jgi:hypothetical protein